MMYEYGEKERNLQKCFKASDKLCRKYKKRTEERIPKEELWEEIGSKKINIIYRRGEDFLSVKKTR